MHIATAMDLGLLLRWRRKELSWSQQKLARAAGVSRSWIVEMEAGKARVELHLVLRTIDALGLALDVSDAEQASAPGIGRTDHIDLDDVLAQHRP